MIILRRPAFRAYEIGLSLVELMIAMVLGLLLIAAVTSLSLNATRSHRSMNRASEQIENGRYAFNLLKEDLEHAGFFGALASSIAKLGLPTALPDPCDATLASFAAGIMYPVVGYSTSPGTCNLELVQDTSVLVIRRTETKVYVWEQSCNDWVWKDPDNVVVCNAERKPGAGYVYLQTIPDSYAFGIRNGETNSFDPGLNILKIGDNPADIRRFLIHIYYIRPWSSISGDGIPTLVRVTLSKNSNSPKMSSPEPIIEGIENMQIQFGIDSSGDGSPDTSYKLPENVTEWSNVVSLKVNLLARSIDQDFGFPPDSKDYNLGNKIVTPGGYYKRHVYSQVIRIVHTSVRRE